MFSCDGGKEILYKAFTEHLGEEFISLRNVAAELEGVKEAVCWAIKFGKEKITIFYDYEGIEAWKTGRWKANNKITQEYVDFIRKNSSSIEIDLKKVPAHSGVVLNEEVDSIAKKALLTKGYKAYDDGSVYFVGYGAEDWETIIHFIDDENAALTESTRPPITLKRAKKGTREKITIIQKNDRVIVNCYNDSRSYVQGKQTVLFQKIIATAVEFLEDKNDIVETLNSYHALTLQPEEVENRFTQLVPAYRHISEKHYSNLLSAVYNTMLTGYMPDYTCLVTPIFRAYEYCLHRILGDVLGLETETRTGANQFSFFNRNHSGFYEFNKDSSNLSPDQLFYLNLLYTKYNSVRHPYSHWSADDIDTAVITDIDIAREILKDGLSLINQYYTLFQ